MADGEDRTDRDPTPPREPPAIEATDRLIANTEVHVNAWEETLEEHRALAEEYRADGWETIPTVAGHTGTVAPVHQKGYWGLSHTVPDSDAERIHEAVQAGEFPAYDVLRQTVRGRVFAVVTYQDPGTETIILLATNFELRRATELVLHAREVGYVNSVFRHLDGRIVAEVRHEAPEKFFPRYEEFESYADDWGVEPPATDEE